MVHKPYTANTSIEAGDWRDQAACLDVDPETFFPVQTNDRQAIDRAKAICGTCAVQEVCLLYALETGQQFGIWGGLTEDERRALRRRKQLARYASR